MVSGGNTILYTLGYAAGGVGTGAPVALLANTTQISQPDYTNAPAGGYANNQPVSFTISWTQGGGGSIIATLPAGSVNGTVINTCVVSQSPGTLTFAIDPSASAAAATLSPDLLIKCTMGNAVSISAASACGGALYSAYPPSCSGYGIPYLFTCLGSGAGCSGNIAGGGFAGSGIPLQIGGSATSAGYENAPVGTYGDLQTVTISY
jgi:hypothetical protein